MSEKLLKKGVVLAGGRGTRLYPLTLEIPKPLIPVKKKPLINYSIEMLAQHGITDIRVIVCAEERKDFERWLKAYGEELRSLGAIITLMEETEPMGTFGFIAHSLKDWMGSDDIIVTNSDDIKDVDISRMREFHAANAAGATIALMEMEHPDDYGVALMKGSRIASFKEKEQNAPRGLISIGAYLLGPAALAVAAPLVEAGQRFIMIEKDIFPKIAGEGNLCGFVHGGIYKDCGTLEKWIAMVKE